MCPSKCSLLWKESGCWRCPLARKESSDGFDNLVVFSRGIMSCLDADARLKCHVFKPIKVNLLSANQKGVRAQDDNYYCKKTNQKNTRQNSGADTDWNMQNNQAPDDQHSSRADWWLAPAGSGAPARFLPGWAWWGWTHGCRWLPCFWSDNLHFPFCFMGITTGPSQRGSNPYS